MYMDSLKSYRNLYDCLSKKERHLLNIFFFGFIYENVLFQREIKNCICIINE